MPRFFRLLSMGDDQDKSLVFLDAEPPEIGLHGYRLAVGKPMVEFYPPILRMQMQPESPGIRLADVIGNLMGYLIVTGAMKDVIQSFSPPNLVEFFRFDLINHKGRVHSRDCWIVNPLLHIDCLDTAASEISWAPSDPTKCLSIERYVFDSTRVPADIHIFRIATDPRQYFIDDEVAAEMQRRQFKNVYLDEVEVR